MSFCKIPHGTAGFFQIFFIRFCKAFDQISILPQIDTVRFHFAGQPVKTGLYLNPHIPQQELVTEICLKFLLISAGHDLSRIYLRRFFKHSVLFFRKGLVFCGQAAQKEKGYDSYKNPACDDCRPPV